jgi:hypothetical protein
LSLIVMQFLKTWLIQRIPGTDREYQGHLNTNGIR